MVRIRRFGIVSTATVVAVLYAIVALCFVALLALFALFGLAVTPAETRGTFGAGVVGLLVFGLLIVVFYAITGWVFTAIACALYNLVAGWVGGIEMQVEGPMGGGPAGGYPAAGYPGGYPAPGAYPVPGPYPAPGTYPAPAPSPAPSPAPGSSMPPGRYPPPAPGR
jgi:hypothetical protein